MQEFCLSITSTNGMRENVHALVAN